MTKKKQVKKPDGCKSPDLHPKEPEPDYSEGCIIFTKFCINLSIKFIKLVYTLFKHTYKRIQVWLAWRQLKKDVRECAECRDYFDKREVK